MRAIASQAAIAIDNARLQRQIKATNEQLILSGLRLRTIIETIPAGVGVFRDISEMKSLDRLKDEFISITSHELKSPLTVVRGYAQLLLRRAQGAPGGEEEQK